MAARGWPFLVARGRERGYEVLLAPPVLREKYGLLEEVAGPTTRVQVEALDRYHVVWHEHRTSETDEHGRPLRLFYGFVTEADVTEPSEVDLHEALQTALGTHERFLADEEHFTIEFAGDFPLRSITRPPRRAAAIAAAAAGLVLVGVVLAATDEPDPAPPPPSPSQTTSSSPSRR